MIAIHPEATGDPAVVRWVVPAGALSLVGPVCEAPGAVGDLIADGTLTEVVLEPDAVLTRIGEGHNWASAGAPVRDALAVSLESPEGWRTPLASDPDAVLRAALDQVLGGPAGDYIQSHGGAVTVLSAHDERVELLMSGTCAGCPALGFTLHSRLEAQLRAIHPQLRSLEATQEPAGHAPAWLPFGRRRGA